MTKLFFGHAQHQGDREYQEDTIGFQVYEETISAIPGLILVADGMGGHIGGKIASEIAVTAFLDCFAKSTATEINERLLEAVYCSNEEIRKRIEEEPRLEGMGCTLIAMAQEGVGWHWLSVGDSGLWHVRDTEVERLNADHSMAAVFRDLVEEGRMTQERPTMIQDDRLCAAP